MIYSIKTAYAIKKNISTLKLKYQNSQISNFILAIFHITTTHLFTHEKNKKIPLNPSIENNQYQRHTCKFTIIHIMRL